MAFDRRALILSSDIHSGNLLEGIEDERLLAKMEEDELQEPCPRKDAGDRIIYATRYVQEPGTIIYLCDLGNATILGDESVRPHPPKHYRAPELILRMKWGHAIDMWTIAIMVCDLSVCCLGISPCWLISLCV